MEVISAGDCGNAPKKKLLRDFTISFVEGKIDDCLEWMTDEVVFHDVGRKRMYGKKNIAAYWHLLFQANIEKLHIENIITHGNVASVNGEITKEDNNVLHFCFVYHFNGFGKKAKIKEITSYLIEEMK